MQLTHADFFVPATKKRMKDYYIVKEVQQDELNEALISLMYEGWQLCTVNVIHRNIKSEIQVSYQFVFKKRLSYLKLFYAH